VLNVNDGVVTYILCDQMFRIIIILFPVSMPNRIVLSIWLLNLTAYVCLYFALGEQGHHSDLPSDPIGAGKSIACHFGTVMAPSRVLITGMETDGEAPCAASGVSRVVGVTPGLDILYEI
jgi:hypothetical protein